MSAPACAGSGILGFFSYAEVPGVIFALSAKSRSISHALWLREFSRAVGPVVSFLSAVSFPRRIEPVVWIGMKRFDSGFLLCTLV